MIKVTQIKFKIKELIDYIKLYFSQKFIFFKNHKTFLISLFVVLFLIGGGVLIPLVSFAASWLEEGIEALVCIVAGLILHLIVIFLCVLLTLAGWILDWILGDALNVHTSPVVGDGWRLVRDVANMFFIIFLLIIAFATILRIEAYQYKALLPKLILGILLVNFSRTICTVFIEFSNVLTGFFLNIDNKRESANALIGLMGASSVWEVDDAYSWLITDYHMLLSLAFIALILGILTVAFLGLTGMLIVRTVALLVLIVLSPLAFAMNILPVTKTYFTKWWENFLKYVWYAPLAAFMLYIALLVATSPEPVGIGKPLASQIVDTSTNINFNLLVTKSSNAEFTYKFMLVIGLLFAALMLIKEGGGMLAEMMMKGAKFGMLGVGAAAAGFAGKRLSRTLARGGRGRITSALKSSKYGFAQKLGQFSERFGKGLAFLSPTIVKGAWKARQAELDRKAYGESIGWAHQKMNRAFMDKDKTDYERLHQGHMVSEEMKKLKAANPAGAHAFYRDQLYAAVKAGDMNRAEAAFRLLAEKNNDNEITRDIGINPELGKLLHSRKFVAEGRANEQSDEAIADMLYHIFGEERGRQILMDMGEHGKYRGNWQYAEAVKYDKAKGKFVDNPERGEYAAAEYNKLGSDDKARQSRFTFCTMKYGKDGSEEVTGLTSNFKVVLEKYGYTETDADRAPRFVSKVTQEALLSPAALKQIKDIIKAQLESADSAIQERGRLNAQWIMSGTTGARVRLTSVEDAKQKFKDYFEKKMEEQGTKVTW